MVQPYLLLLSPPIRRSYVNSVSTIVAVSFCLLPSVTLAQTRVRGHVILPRTYGATVLSTYIDAEARRAVAIGDFLQSAAVARKINLEADRMAMENSLRWIETYFERRKLNREYRQAERLDYREYQTTLAQNFHRRISNAESSGNQIDEMNYMMGRLLADTATYKAIFLDEIKVGQGTDLTLTPNELTHILLKNEDGTQGASPFRPTDPRLVSDEWPKVFLRSEFDDVRDRYDAAREQAVNEINAGELSIKTLERMQAQLQQVEKKFEQVYVWKLMKDSVDTKTFVAYKKSGESFLRSQAAGSLRAFVLDSPDSYTNELQFDGDTLVDLIRHCAQHELVFAEPTADDKPTYSRIYHDLRQLYLKYSPEQPDFNL